MAERSTPWIEALAELVVSCMEAQSAMGPMTWQYVEREGVEELVVYPTPVELVGGEADGVIVMPGFALDLHDLLAAFDQVTGLYQ